MSHDNSCMIQLYDPVVCGVCTCTCTWYMYMYTFSLVDGLLYSVHVHIMIGTHVHELMYMVITKVSIHQYIL